MSGGPIPATLYKYLAPERADIFETGKVRFSQLAALNDPLEFYFNLNLGEELRDDVERALKMWSLDAISQTVERVLSETPELQEKLMNLTEAQRDQLRAAVREKVLEGLPARRAALEAQIAQVIARGQVDIRQELEPLLASQIRVFSCAENGMCVPMWAHYTRNHTGFLIAFDPVRMFAASSSEAPDSVEYSDEPYRYQTGSETGFLLRKAADWAYEREWRYVRELEDADAEAVIHLADFDIGAIQEITFGLQATSETIDRVAAALQRRGFAPAMSRVVRGQHYRLEKAPLARGV